MKFHTFAAVIFAIYFGFVIYGRHNLNENTTGATIGHYESHRSFSVYDLLYQKEFPWEEWKVRNRKLKLKY